MKTTSTTKGKLIVLMLATSFLFLHYQNLVAQCPNGSCGPNLLPNANFEITSQSCGDPTISCVLFYDSSKVAGWYGTAPSSAGLAQPNTPDYSNPACTGSPFGCNNFGTACSGAGHVWLADVNYEYIQSQLITPLVAGTNYCFTFIYRPGVNVTGMGIWLHNLGKIYHTGQSIFNGQPPTMVFTSTGVSGCQTATLNFTAAGGETWILLGPTSSDQEITLDSLSLREQCTSTGISPSLDNPSTAIQVFSNPINNTLNVTSHTKQVLEITVYDITARKLLQQKFTRFVSLNTQPLTKGIYMYEVRNKNNVCAKGKVMKD